ncbi:twitching motility protein PilT, partial [Pseudoalteromonas ruthenica]
PSAPKSIDRSIAGCPGEENHMVRSMLSESLRGVISQTLLKKVSGGRIGAHELRIGSPAIGTGSRAGEMGRGVSGRP